MDHVTLVRTRFSSCIASLPVTLSNTHTNSNKVERSTLSFTMNPSARDRSPMPHTQTQMLALTCPPFFNSLSSLITSTSSPTFSPCNSSTLLLTTESRHRMNGLWLFSSAMV